jgi:hypothetical protein
LRTSVLAAVAAILTAAASVLIANPAAAAVTLFSQRQVTQTVRVHADEHGSATATCSPGETNSGGGFRVAGTTDPDAYTVLVSAPYGNGWNVQLYLDPALSYVDVTAYAVCLRKIVGDPTIGRRVVVLYATGPSGDVAAAAPMCDATEVATGGGYAVPSISTNTYTVFVDAPQSANGWNVQLYSDYVPELWAYVVCLRVPADIGPVKRRTVYGAGLTHGGSTASTAAYCSATDEIASGGGYVVASINPHDYAVLSTVPAGTAAWKSTFFLDEDPSLDIDVSSHVVCLKNLY